jgi:MFS family permease
MLLLKKMINKTGLRGYPPGIWAAMGISAVRSTGYAISFTYLPLYLYQERGISMTLVGSILLVSGIISGLSQILGGALADRFGYRKMYIIFQVVETVLFAFLAVLIGMNAAIWSIFFTSTLVTIMGSMSAPAVSAIVADVSQKERLAQSYGLMAIGGNLGWAIGPFMGGYLHGLVSYAWIFGIGAVLAAISLLGAPYLPRDSVRQSNGLSTRKNLAVFLSNSTLIIFCAISMLFFLEISQWGSTLSVFTVDRIGFSTQQYGLLMSISGILIIIFQYPISQRIDWLGYRKALFLGCLLYGAGFLSFAWVKSFLPAVGSIVILVAGEMLFIPTSYAVVSKISSLDDRAKSMGMFGLCGTIGSSFGPLFGGFLLDRFPTQPLFLWAPVAFPGRGDFRTMAGIYKDRSR